MTSDNSPGRKCSLCGAFYTDYSGHDYDQCVESLEELRRLLFTQMHNCNEFLFKAKAIQAEDWWKPQVAKAKAEREKLLESSGGFKIIGDPVNGEH